MERTAVSLVLVFMLTSLTADTASAGMALSSPPISVVTVQGFPFHYENKFRVYNRGDADSVFTVDVLTVCQDVRDWISFDKKVFVLKPNESTQVTFFMDAKEGFIGDCEVIIRPLMLPEAETLLNGAAASQRAYIKTGVDMRFILNVPDAVGMASLGKRPAPKDKVAADQKASDKKAVEETLSSETGVLKTRLDKPLSVEIPSTAVVGQPCALSVSFIGGGEPEEMGLSLTSPSGINYRLPKTASFTFDEKGKWAVLVVIGNEVILGKTVNVLPSQNSLSESGALLVGRVIGAGSGFIGIVGLILAFNLVAIFAYAYWRVRGY